MLARGIKQKTKFEGGVNLFRRENASLLPGIAIVNAYTLIAILYCTASSILFYYVVRNIFLAEIHLFAMIVVAGNYFVLVQTKNFKRATNIILTTGTVVVISLFATGGWANTGYLWPFAYLPFAFFLSERKAVLNWVTLLICGCLLIVILHYAGLISLPYSSAALLNYFAALSVFTICIFLFQNATIKREESLSSTEILLGAAPDAVIVIDNEGKIVKWNHKSETLFGWSGNEVYGRLLGEIMIPPRHQASYNKWFKHFIKTGKGNAIDKRIEIRAVTRNHTEFDVSLSISPATVHGQRMLIGFVRDITEIKKAEEKMKESEQMFTTLFFKSPVLKAIVEADTGEFIEINTAFADFLGRSKKEILGKTSVDINMFDSPEQRKEVTNLIRQNGFVRELELQFKTRDGEARWLSVNVDTLNVNGKDCFLSAGINITKRKLAEENLLKLSREMEEKILERTEEIKRSEIRYRNLFQNNPMPMWVFDLSTFKFMDVNEAAVSHYGYSREEFLSMSALDIRPEYEKDRFRKADHSDKIFPTNYNRGIWRHRKKDGSVIDVEIIGHNIIYEGIPCRFILSNDVTERLKAEKALKQAETNYREIFDKASDAIYVHDIDTGQLLEVNQRASEITGYSQDELLTMNPQEFITDHPDYTFQHAIDFLRKAATGEPQLFEWLGKNKDSSANWLEVHLKKATIAGTERILAFFREINDRKKAQLEIQELNEKLEQKVQERTEQLEAANRDLEAFSYSVSHDLRSPLRAINGFANILGMEHTGLFNEEGMRLLDRIRINAKKMGILIDDLLEFSRLGRKEIHKSTIQMTELAESVLLEISASQTHNAIIRIHPLHPAEADATMLKQVMINLLLNAIKYSSKTENPYIELNSREEENEIIYSVRDNGVGFSDQYANKLFGVFERLHSQSDFEGTGVGLALVKRIISKHGGRVWATGEVNKGATFFFSLPVNNIH